MVSRSVGLMESEKVVSCVSTHDPSGGEAETIPTQILRQWLVAFRTNSKLDILWSTSAYYGNPLCRSGRSPLTQKMVTSRLLCFLDKKRRKNRKNKKITLLLQREGRSLSNIYMAECCFRAIVSLSHLLLLQASWKLQIAHRMHEVTVKMSGALPGCCFMPVPQQFLIGSRVEHDREYKEQKYYLGNS